MKAYLPSMAIQALRKATIECKLLVDDESMAQRAQVRGLALMEDKVGIINKEPQSDKQINQGSPSPSANSNASDRQVSHAAHLTRKGGNGIHNYCQTTRVSEMGSRHHSMLEQYYDDDAVEEKVEPGVRGLSVRCQRRRL
jgi:hypothetical protein